MSWGGVMAGQLGWGIIEEGWRKGPWTSEEDRLLIEYVRLHGEGRWNSVARLAGLRRNGKSCRLRWVNYLRPDLKRGQITEHEESIILDLHARWGNRWSTIARSLPGRTDNEIKNYWRTHFKKKAKISSSAADNSDKAKNNRLLKRQQFHQQQQQQQQQHEQQQVLQQQEQQQQQQMMQLNQLDMKKILFLLDENYEQKSTTSPIYLPQPRQEMVETSLYLDHEQVQQAAAGSFFNYNSMPNNNGSAASVSTAETATSNEDILWDGLWNLDDFHVNFGGACATSKASLHNLVAPFC